MRVIEIEGIGEVVIRKSARAKRLILKIDTEGKPVVTIPSYVPYIVGEKYAIKNSGWLKEHSRSHVLPRLHQGMRIGNHYTLQFVYKAGTEKITTRVQSQMIYVTLPQSSLIADTDVQSAALKAVTRAIKRQAQIDLPKQLHALANEFGYTYRSVSVKNMTSRWGSCSSEGAIALNMWLMQVPPELRRYVLCHELAHLNNPHHQKSFWNELSLMDPNYKIHRSQLKKFQPSFSRQA